MRILFVIPPADFGIGPGPVDRVYGCNYAYDYKPPIHFLTLATVVRDLGHEVRFMDCPGEEISGHRFRNMAAKSHWDVVFFHSVYLSMPEDLKAAQVLINGAKFQRKPEPTIILEGTGSGWQPEKFDSLEKAFIIHGEPEITTTELLKALENDGDLEGMPGLGFWREDGSYHKGPFRALLDIDTLPIPDRSLLKGTNYWLNRVESRPITTLFTSRGCGYRCTFCTPNAVDQSIELEFKKLQKTYVKRPPLRQRSAKLVIEEFEQVKAMGYKAVEVCDNLFIFDKKRTLEICEGIAPLGLEWLCLSRAPFLHDESLVRAMAKAGCKMVYIGSESFDQAILDDVNKDMKISDIREAVRVCNLAGVHPEVSVMMGGSAKESKETIRHSVKVAKSLGTDFVHFSIALPTPSTELYDIAKKEGWFTDGDFFPVDNAREAIVNLPNISATELQEELKRALAGQYLSPKGVMKQLARVRSPEDVIHKAKAAKKLVRYLFDR